MSALQSVYLMDARVHSQPRAGRDVRGTPNSALGWGALGAVAHEINNAYLSVKQQLPMAHASNIDVHKVRAAIIPHSSAMQA
jgi:hypothetical protein